MVVVALVLFVAGIGLLFLAYRLDEMNKRTLERNREEQTNTLGWLRKQRELARVRNDIAHIEEQVELRPLVLETKKAILQGKADKRLLDAVFARRALDDVLGAGGATPEADPLEGARIKLLTEIENRKADGRETADLDAALRALRTIRDEIA